MWNKWRQSLPRDSGSPSNRCGIMPSRLPPCLSLSSRQISVSLQPILKLPVRESLDGFQMHCRWRQEAPFLSIVLKSQLAHLPMSSKSLNPSFPACPHSQRVRKWLYWGEVLPFVWVPLCYTCCQEFILAYHRNFWHSLKEKKKKRNLRFESK